MGFFDGAVGNPADGRRRIMPQAVRGVSSYGTPRDFLDNAGDFAINKTTVEPDKRTAGGEPTSMLPGKSIIGAKTLPLGALDPNSPAFLIACANLFGAYTFDDDTPVADARRWYFGLDGETAADPYIELHDDTSVLPPTRHLDCLVPSLEIAVGEKINATFGLLVPDYDFWDTPTQETGTGSTLPTIRGVMLEPMSEDDVTGQTLEIAIVSNVAGLITYNTGLGGAAVGGAYTYQLGQGPQILKDETGAEIGGGRGNPATIAWPLGSTLVALDTFEVLARRPRWTQSVGTRVDFAAIWTRFYLDDALVKVEGGYTWRFGWASSGMDNDVSYETGGTPWRSGSLITTLELSRTVVDLLLQAGLHNRSKLSVVTDVASDLMIVGTSPYRARVVAPYMLGAGQMYTQALGSARAQERHTLRAGVPLTAYTDPVAGGSFSSAAAILVENGVAAF